MKTVFSSLVAIVLCGVAVMASGEDKKSGAGYKLGDKLPSAAVPSAPAETFKLTSWDDLMPKDWDPMKGLKQPNFAMMRDGDPEATRMLNEMKKAWDNAPADPALDKARIRIAGFVVPLDREGKALREFLLVPYFGACIHTPPPPSNQVIHVTLATPAKDFHTMDAVWISGQMRVAFSDTDMGTASYRMEGQSIAPYRRP